MRRRSLISLFRSTGLRRTALALAVVLPSVVLPGCTGADRDSVREERFRPIADAIADVQAVSLLGDSLTRSMLDSGSWALQDSLLAEALSEMEASPDDPDPLIWVGRRFGYLGRYDEAIEVFGSGMERFPGDARFPRHRGHRLITVRDFPGAVADLSAALELVEGRPDRIEPDGLPNARGIPVSTLHSNIRYHLGLAHYLLGDWGAAEEAFGADVEASVNPDMHVASSYWLYLIRRRIGDEAGARAVLEAVHPGMDIVENTAYYRLLLLFKGELSEEDLAGPEGGVTLQGTTTAYGIGAWRLLEGDRDGAFSVFREIVAGRSQWPAFGYIAAEAELAGAGE